MRKFLILVKDLGCPGISVREPIHAKVWGARIYLPGEKGTRVGLGVRVSVERNASVDVGKGVTLGVKDGSKQAGIESTRAAGSRV